jgi:hypothetical protein
VLSQALRAFFPLISDYLRAIAALPAAAGPRFLRCFEAWDGALDTALPVCERAGTDTNKYRGDALPNDALAGPHILVFGGGAGIPR